MTQPGKRQRHELKTHIREHNQTAILAAAEKVLARQGLANATIKLVAEEAGLPHANVHYYFGSKQGLLDAVLENILSIWLTSVRRFDEQAGPRECLTGYIEEKIQLSRKHPSASKVFAMALISEQPFVLNYLREHFYRELQREQAIIESWVEQGLMQPVSTPHLFLTIWAVTQTYADFDAQVKIMLGKDTIEEGDYREATDLLCKMVLAACGVE